MTERSEYIFTTCQVGAEPALKQELARKHLDLRLAFSRPGFVTFKIISKPEEYGVDFQLRSIFAKTYGLSIGKTDFDHFAATVQEYYQPGKKLRLHVWERDLFVSGKGPKDFIPGLLAKQVKESLDQLQLGDIFHPDPIAIEGDRVIDLIVIDQDSWWLGFHTHNSFHSPFPGSNSDIVLPSEAPSRAYLKIEEALQWFKIPIRKGDTAVEIGSAPGGSCYALLKRGLNVVGIDAGAMEANIVNHSRFQHVKKSVAQIFREDLPESVQWLLLDMNVSHGISLSAVDRLVSLLKPNLLGVILTIKLNKWKDADQISSILDHIKDMGISKIQARQLINNRQEFTVYGHAKKGMNR